MTPDQQYLAIITRQSHWLRGKRPSNDTKFYTYEVTLWIWNEGEWRLNNTSPSFKTHLTALRNANLHVMKLGAGIIDLSGEK